MSSILAQGLVCSEADPFCSNSSNVITFPNTFNGSVAEAGPDYGCLVEQRNPAWYYIKISNSGNLNLRIAQNTLATGNGVQLDVDFIIWGPFENLNVCDSQNLSSDNEVDCSFDIAAIENAYIPNAISGEIYMMLITNYSDQAGYITLEQTGGTGSTDCSIVAGNLGPDQSACAGDTITLDGTTQGVVAYDWFLNGNPIDGENGAIIEVTESGTYVLQVTDELGNTDSDEVEITFIEIPTPNTPNDKVLCTQNSTGTFDLTETFDELLGEGTEEDFIVTFHENQSDADLGQNELPNTITLAEPSKQIYVRVENIELGDCADTSVSFQLIVAQQPLVIVLDDFLVCDNALDGDDTNGLVQNLDFTQLDNSITNGQQNLAVTYHGNLADANTGNTPLSFPYANQNRNETIYYRLRDTNTDCTNVGSFELTVDEVVRVQHTTLSQCDGIDGVIDGSAPYDLSMANVDLLANGMVEDYEFSYYESLQDAENETNALDLPYESVTLDQVVYARVEKIGSPCFEFAEISLQTTTNLIDDQVLTACDDSGYHEFDLNEAIVLFNEALQIEGLQTNFYETILDAELQINPLPFNYTNTVTFSHSIYASIQSENFCVAVGTLNLEVNTYPQFDLGETKLLCLSANGSVTTAPTLSTGLSQDDHTFVWYLNDNVVPMQNGASILAMEAGTYMVEATHTISGCVGFDSVDVQSSSPPYGVQITTDSPVYSNSQQITISVQGSGEYEFVLDGAVVQDNGVFMGVSPGFHTVSICNTDGCGCIIDEFSILYYPRFFTPNADGTNDRWYIPRDLTITDATVFIFDRYGTLLKALADDSIGWDGTYRGKNMPSDDYWFIMRFKEDETPREIKGHFTLKR